ncbi:hypothetical protein [Sinosporangium siamense]|uniref:RanBP2-type domain-containing protein n=1 Tax=Sinosporangium siamense TaxID=1367973 RepID=A0A919RKF8_9ACTN|nr:hypothetical protein [Sinosporangium siamense]GII95467.1 hypothetical protein Ssi02_56980 [Sinosporangium siamense]
MTEPTWQCSKCDTFNHQKKDNCDGCGRPEDHTSHPPTTALASTWRCRLCDVWNDGAETTCNGCDTPGEHGTIAGPLRLIPLLGLATILALVFLGCLAAFLR